MNEVIVNGVTFEAIDAPTRLCFKDFDDIDDESKWCAFYSRFSAGCGSEGTQCISHQREDERYVIWIEKEKQ